MNRLKTVSLLLSILITSGCVSTKETASVNSKPMPEYTVVSSVDADFNETQSLANQGDVDAQNILGKMYLEGVLVQKDEAKGFEWIKKAAEQGHILAQVNLGTLYLFGTGTAQNKDLAKKWLKKSCDNGSKVGCVYYTQADKP